MVAGFSPQEFKQIQQISLPRRNLVEVLQQRARFEPHLRACVHLNEEGVESATLDYEALDRAARSVASVLQRYECRGRRALLLFPSGLDFVVAYLGCLYAGAVALPIEANSPRRPSRHLAGIVRDAQPDFALTLAENAEEWRALLSLPALTWIASDAIGPAGAEAWEDPELDLAEIATLQYTSGSTESPKGVMVSHGNLAHNLEAIRHHFGHSAQSCMVSWLPHYHDMGLVGGILQPLYVGFPTVLMSPLVFMQRPIRWLEAISRFRGTTSGAPNFAYEHCLRRIPEERRAGLDLRSWKVAYNGAEPVRAATLTRFSEAFAACGFGRESFYPCYGMAETTLLVAGGDADRAPVTLSRGGRTSRAAGARAEQIVSCGQPVPLHEVAVVDPSTGRQRGPGENGEIWVAGPSVAAGYWNKPRETERTFGATLPGYAGLRFLRTGDVGFVSNGELFISGRSKNVIVIAGVNHHPEDIERTVENAHPWAHPGRCVVFGVDGAETEKLIVAVELERRQWQLLRKQVAAAPLEELAGAVRRFVSRVHGVRVDRLVPLPPLALPRTSSGKVRRRVSRQQFLDDAWPRLLGPVSRRARRSAGLSERSTT